MEEVWDKLRAKVKAAKLKRRWFRHAQRVLVPYRTQDAYIGGNVFFMFAGDENRPGLQGYAGVVRYLEAERQRSRERRRQRGGGGLVDLIDAEPDEEDPIVCDDEPDADDRPREAPVDGGLAGELSYEHGWDDGFLDCKDRVLRALRVAFDDPRGF